MTRSKQELADEIKQALEYGVADYTKSDYFPVPDGLRELLSEVAEALSADRVPSEAEIARGNEHEANLRRRLDIIAGHASAIVKEVRKGALPHDVPRPDRDTAGEAGGDLVERLRHASTTMSNDDKSQPGSPKRERHAARLATITEAADALAAANAKVARLRSSVAEGFMVCRSKGPGRASVIVEFNGEAALTKAQELHRRLLCLDDRAAAAIGEK